MCQSLEENFFHPKLFISEGVQHSINRDRRSIITVTTVENIETLKSDIVQNHAEEMSILKVPITFNGSIKGLIVDIIASLNHGVLNKEEAVLGKFVRQPIELGIFRLVNC